MSDDNNKKTKVWKSSYDPEAERCCYRCYKTAKTKEGILESKYNFICPPCHKWQRQLGIYSAVGLGIFLGLIILGFVIWSFKNTNRE